MPEPTLAEIANITADPERGTGTPAVVIDQSRMVHELNQGARYYAENQWRKYNQFLANKNDLFKNLDAIQSLSVAPQDKDYLTKQAGEILKDILNNPGIALGGKGYDQIQAKLAKYKGEAMLSKQNKLDDDTNKLFMDRNPELYTDENKKKSEDYWKLPLGSRKPYMLDMPVIFDERTAFEGIKKTATQPYADIVGPNGEPGGEGYIETGEEVNPNAIGELWNMIARGGQDKYGHPILKAIEKNYENLPPDQKAYYDKNGGLEKFFSDRGQQYLKAYFPEGSYQKTPEGNYRFGKKLAADPNYLRQKALDQRAAEMAQRMGIEKQKLALGWAKFGLDEDKMDDEDMEDLIGADTVLNEAIDIINNGREVEFTQPTGIGKETEKVKRRIISDPLLLQKFANLDRDGKITNMPDYIAYNESNDQLSLGYYKRSDAEGDEGYARRTTPGRGRIVDKEIPLDKRTWLKENTKRSFPNKNIGGINQLIEKVLQANGNSLSRIARQRRKGAATGTPAPAQSKIPKLGKGALN